MYLSAKHQLKKTASEFRVCSSGRLAVHQVLLGQCQLEWFCVAGIANGLNCLYSGLKTKRVKGELDEKEYKKVRVF